MTVAAERKYRKVLDACLDYLSGLDELKCCLLLLLLGLGLLCQGSLGRDTLQVCLHRSLILIIPEARGNDGVSRPEDTSKTSMPLIFSSS